MPLSKSFAVIISMLCLLYIPALGNGGIDLGYGPSLTDTGKNVLLLQILPKEKGDEEYAVNVKVLADLRNKIKEGSIVRISADFVPFSGSAESNLPNGDPGTIQLWPVQEKTPTTFKYYDDQGRFPIGLEPSSRIAPSDIDQVKAAMKELGSAVAKEGESGPSHERAENLLRERNFYLWALGVWRLAHDTTSADIQQLKKLFARSDLSPAQAIWLRDVLSSHIRGKEPLPRPSKDEIASLVTAFLREYARRHPGEPGSVAPATAPAPPPP